MGKDRDEQDAKDVEDLVHDINTLQELSGTETTIATPDQES